jgi:hypothetical protein
MGWLAVSPRAGVEGFTMIDLLGSRMRGGIRFVLAAFVVVALWGTAPRAAQARLLRVPDAFGTIQAAVDAASAGDLVDVGPGSHCGATIDKRVTLVGRGLATIVGCADGPVLSNGVRAGFRLPGADGVSAASGTRIEGFVFDGRGISETNLAPLGVAVIATFANDVRVEHNTVLGTVQAITNTAGDRWVIAHNRVEGLTVFDCTGALCGGGDGIVIQVARDGGDAPGGPGAPVNRPKANLVFDNLVTGSIPDGFGVFSMVGVFLFDADGTVVTRNRLAIPDNPDADAIGQGVLVSDVCCGEAPLLPGARNTVITFNDGRDSQIGVEIDGSGGENTQGLALFGNLGPVVVEGVVVDDGPRPRRPFAHRHRPPHRPMF